jgi:dihydrofolate reductase
MRRLGVFNMVSLDGYFAGVDGDISWFKDAPRDPEWDAFIAGNAGGGGMLLFGRVTYELMEEFWTTPFAAEVLPTVADAMNNLPKVVFSRSLEKATWNNTRLVKGDVAAAVQKMKNEPGPDMMILGSGSIVSQLAQARLIDDYQLVVFPVVLGRGKTMFEGVRDNLSLTLTSTRTFGNGNVLLSYQALT